MKNYAAFLRGINLGEKNKVAMKDIKQIFESLDLSNVKTIANSGNVIFSAETDNLDELRFTIHTELSKNYDFDIPVFLIEQTELTDIMQNHPDWWGSGDKALYDNIIFVMNETSFEEIYAACGEPKEGAEKVQPYRNAIFWTYLLKDYQKHAWWKTTATADFKNFITIRTRGTVEKVLKGMENIKG